MKITLNDIARCSGGEHFAFDLTIGAKSFRVEATSQELTDAGNGADTAAAEIARRIVIHFFRKTPITTNFNAVRSAALGRSIEVQESA